MSKTIRDMCVFARQNLIKDPPFSRLDLISCRNVLIYFGPVLQKKVIPIFHFALKPAGFLLLGKSEALGAFPELFTLVDKKYKIYVKKSLVRAVPGDACPCLGIYRRPGSAGGGAGEGRGGGRRRPADLLREADRLVLARYRPGRGHHR